MDRPAAPTIQWSRVQSWIGSWGLIVIGVIGFLIALLDPFVDWGKFFLPIKGVQEPILIVMSALAVALGIERRATIEKMIDEVVETRTNVMAEVAGARSDVTQARSTIDASLSGLETQIKTMQLSLDNVVHVEMLYGEQMVYEEAKRVVESAPDETNIRTTSMGAINSPESESFREYLEAVAKRVKRAVEGGIGMSYRVVMGYLPTQGNQPSPRAQGSIRQRRQLFGSLGIIDRLIIAHYPSTWSLDMLIVGDAVIIGFPMLHGEGTIRLGLKIKDQRFARAVLTWYDDFL